MGQNGEMSPPSGLARRVRGAGAMVDADVEAGATVVGVPAKPLPDRGRHGR